MFLVPMTGERITAAAIRQDGVVCYLPPPARHHDIIAYIYGQTQKPVTGEQGFLTDTGRFVDREVGLHIAKKANQIIEKTGNQKYLFSEDMW